MTKVPDGLANKAFASLLIVLGLDASSLFVIFNYVAGTPLSIEVGLILFVLSAILLMLGYAVTIILAGFLAILVLGYFWNRSRQSTTAISK
jgi:hypothetical protein